MSVDPRNTVDKPGTSPDQGMVARNYVLIVIAAVVIALGAVLIGLSHTHSLGKAGPTTSPASTDKSNPHPQ